MANSTEDINSINAKRRHHIESLSDVELDKIISDPQGYGYSLDQVTYAKAEVAKRADAKPKLNSKEIAEKSALKNLETIQRAAQSKNALELVEIQTLLLNDIYQLQLNQQGNVEILLQEVKRLPQNPGWSDRRVRITDFNVPFISLVGFLVKVSLAAIPATIIMALLIGVLSLLFGGLLATLLSGVRP